MCTTAVQCGTLGTAHGTFGTPFATHRHVQPVQKCLVSFVVYKCTTIVQHGTLGTAHGTFGTPFATQ